MSVLLSRHAMRSGISRKVSLLAMSRVPGPSSSHGTMISISGLPFFPASAGGMFSRSSQSLLLLSAAARRISRVTSAFCCVKMKKEK